MHKKVDVKCSETSYGNGFPLAFELQFFTGVDQRMRLFNGQRCVRNLLSWLNRAAIVR